MRAGIDFATRQSIGEREEQEDFCGCCPLEGNNLLVILADGMGGYKAGESASELAANSFVENFLASELPIRKKFQNALHFANGTLLDEINSNKKKYMGMGTTLVGAVISEKGTEWVSVGDSPLFHWNSVRLSMSRLNADHSMTPEVEKQLMERDFSENERIALEQRRSNLRSALTGDKVQLIDYSEVAAEFQSGDILLLASDGIMTLDEHKIADILEINQKESADVIAERILAAVASRRLEHQDNTSIVVVKLGAFVEGSPTP